MSCSDWLGEKNTKDTFLDLGRRMLAVLCAAHDLTAEALAVEEPFRLPPIDPETGELLDRNLPGTLDHLEKASATASFTGSAEGALAGAAPARTGISTLFPGSQHGR